MKKFILTEKQYKKLLNRIKENLTYDVDDPNRKDYENTLYEIFYYILSDYIINGIKKEPKPISPFKKDRFTNFLESFDEKDPNFYIFYAELFDIFKEAVFSNIDDYSLIQPINSTNYIMYKNIFHERLNDLVNLSKNLEMDELFDDNSTIAHYLESFHELYKYFQETGSIEPEILGINVKERKLDTIDDILDYANELGGINKLPKELLQKLDNLSKLNESFKTYLKILNLFEIKETLTEAEYRGRKVKLGKPFRTPGGPKKFSVYVKNKKGNVIKVNFGDPKLKIKNANKKRAKSFQARHKCSEKKDRTKAGYWSCNVSRYGKSLGLTSKRKW